LIIDANLTDFDELLPLAKFIHSQSIFADTDFNESEVRRTFATAITFEDGFAKVVKHNGKIVGALIGFVAKNQWGIRIATDLLTFSQRQTDALIRSFSEWAKTRGAVAVNITDLTMRGRYQKLILSVGFEPAGNNFIKRV